MKILLQNIDVPGIQNFEVYRRLGGYSAVEKALKTMVHSEVVKEVKDSGLRGRGGAGFPTGMKWFFIDHTTDKPKYMICNADEGEPGTFKDRYLMQHNPHLLVEGMILSSFAIESSTAYIYIRGELFSILHILEKAIGEAYANGFLGKNILGSGYSLDIYCHPGAGAYICGEETALIESLEGNRGNPRMKPPFPAVAGLYGCPTVVNNVETICNIPWIVNNSGAEFAKLGTDKSPGTKLISACGHIRYPGVYEIELGMPVNEFLYSNEYCGGIRDNHQLKAVIAGGSSVPVLPADLILRTPKGEPRLLSYESLSEGGFDSGTMLGSGGFIVMDETTCMVRQLLSYARFYYDESCGQCSPCREGTGWMEKILHRLENGRGRMKDIDLLASVAKNIEGNTICPLGDAAAWPVRSFIHHFRDEFEWHVNEPLACLNMHQVTV
ncbi:MAG: NADH-quinone oxidoreductase subunit NuoF [Bacteroidia bacterium]|nr:NADH-quinone oxidoreductase subunit NuoF [Bacteroidia bacterium]